MHATPAHATPRVKYFGAKQGDDRTIVEEATHGIQGGGVARACLVRRAFGGNSSARLRVRLRCSLVRSTLLCGLEVAL
eukprot:2641458-Pyramimonas_sp.AAC.1